MKMTCTVLLTPHNGRFRAQVAELPNVEVEAEGRDEALALLEKRIQEIIRRSEILHLEIPAPTKLSRQKSSVAKPPNLVKFEAPRVLNDPDPQRKGFWDYYGIFKDDPTLWPMIDEIERRRDRQRIPTSKRRRG
jgi:predicted RNase H-like HicB family nuclease